MSERIDFSQLSVVDLDGKPVELALTFDRRLLLICLRHLA